MDIFSLVSVHTRVFWPPCPSQGRRSRSQAIAGSEPYSIYTRCTHQVGFFVDNINTPVESPLFAVRPASTQDVSEVKQLERKLFSKSDSWAASIDKELQKRNALLLVAQASPEHRHSNEVCGYLMLAFSSVNMHIGKLAVRDDCRRLGVATLLVKEAFRIASSERRCMSSTLHVNPTNTAAVSLYTRLGFEEDGKLHDYYGHGKPAIKMMLDLAVWKDREEELRAATATTATGTEPEPEQQQ